MADLLGYIIAAAGLIAAFLGYGAVQRGRGKRDERQDAKRKAAERAVKLERERGELDDDIQDDTDLVGRAIRAGSLRPGDE